MKIVIDRFEGDVAILLFGDDEIKVDFPRSLLPSGAKEGSWLTVSLELDVEGEQAQREKISEQLKRLRERNK